MTRTSVNVEALRIAAPPVFGGPLCCVEDVVGWLCCRPAGHGGRHAAYGVYTVLRVWSES